YYEQGNPTPRSVTRTINAGEMLIFDQAVQSLFGLASSAGGALVVSTPSNSKLVATARTYNLTSQGTYGQFVPGVTAAEGVGVQRQGFIEGHQRKRTNRRLRFADRQSDERSDVYPGAVKAEGGRQKFRCFAFYFCLLPSAFIMRPAFAEVALGRSAIRRRGDRQRAGRIRCRDSCRSAWHESRRH